jgi:Co/Zn/Cd efflux system component
LENQQKRNLVMESRTGTTNVQMARFGALAGGKFLGYNWLDPVMGIVGSAVIAQWA